MAGDEWVASGEGGDCEVEEYSPAPELVDEAWSAAGCGDGEEGVEIGGVGDGAVYDQEDQAAEDADIPVNGIGDEQVFEEH